MKKETIRGRKPIIRSLPPISETCAAFKGYEGDETRSERVFELLATVIQRHRRAVPLPFYAMRDVATFFEVSLTTVAKVYRRLDREGALTLVRSSQSMIAPRVPRSRLALRGVGCMPVWLPGFLLFLDWRQCVSQLEEEFSPYRFVAEPIFYKYDESGHPAFVDRLLKYNPDYILWYCPCQTDISTMHSLVDAGVPMVVIQDAPGNYPGKSYHLSYEKGLRHGLKEWAASGEVDDIVVPQDRTVGSSMWFLEPILQSCSLSYRVKVLPPASSLSDFLRQLAPNPRTAIIFENDFLYAKSCATAPDAMFELFKKNRVLVTRKITVFSELPDLTVDTLFFPWKKVGRRIAMDLSKAKGSLPAEQPVFEAEWRPRTPLREVMQTGYLE